MSTQPVRIKICGLTRPDDAHLAAALGAWAVGFVFWPGSPRSVSLETARRMMAVLPPVVTSVGVFVNQPIVEVRLNRDRGGPRCGSTAMELSPLVLR